MNIQPALMLALIVFFLLGIIEMLRLLWYGSAIVLAFIFVYYVFSAARLSVKYKDWVAMLMFVLYFVRAFAWLTGAAITAVEYLRGDAR